MNILINGTLIIVLATILILTYLWAFKVGDLDTSSILKQLILILNIILQMKVNKLPIRIFMLILFSLQLCLQEEWMEVLEQQFHSKWKWHLQQPEPELVLDKQQLQELQKMEWQKKCQLKEVDQLALLMVRWHLLRVLQYHKIQKHF